MNQKKSKNKSRK